MQKKKKHKGKQRGTNVWEGHKKISQTSVIDNNSRTSHRLVIIENL